MLAPADGVEVNNTAAVGELVVGGEVVAAASTAEVNVTVPDMEMRKKIKTQGCQSNCQPFQHYSSLVYGYTLGIYIQTEFSCTSRIAGEGCFDSNRNRLCVP